MTRPWIIALVAAVSLAGPATVVAQSPTPLDDAVASPIREAVGFLPASGTDVAFTDWARIRASQGAQDLDGASPLEAKMDFLLSTSQDEAATSGFGLSRLRGHRDAWGFDTLDLDWEATYSVDGPPVHVLRFREGFDLAPVMARFDERGFSTTQDQGAVIRSHDMDMTSDWLTATEFSILNTAFLDDGRTLVLSSGLDGLRSVLQARSERRLADPAVSDVVEALEGASAAWVAVGPGTCAVFDELPFDLGEPLASGPAPASRAPLHPYLALGVAYARPDWDPIGRIAMGYLDDASAAADLDARAEMARTGVSVRARAPYSEAVFTVDDARVDDRALTIEVSPVDDRPTKLFQMVFARDMTFAGC